MQANGFRNTLPRHLSTGTLAGCGPATPATLTRAGDAFAFSATDGVLVLHGTTAADGTLAATLNTQPPSKPPFLLTVNGRAAAESVTPSYVTPRCTAAGTLTRVHPSLR